MCYNMFVNMKEEYSRNKKYAEDVFINTKIIRDYLVRHNLSLIEFAKQSDVKFITITHLLNNLLDKVNIVDISKIAKTINCSIMDLIIEFNSKY